MLLLIACIGMFPGLPQQPTVILTQEATNLKVIWTSVLQRPADSHWVGLVQPDRPDSFVDVPSTRYQYIPASASGVTTGEMTFLIPGPGSWEARYYSGNAGPVVARSPALVVTNALPVDPVDPGDPLPPVAQTRRVTRVRIVRANGTTELRPPEETTSIVNPAQSALELVLGQLLAGDEAFVDEWEEPVVLPTRTPDRVWRVKVNVAIP